MTQSKNPQWWTPDYDSTWERTKAAFKRDWDQTVHDVGGDKPDTNQGVSDTLKQAAGKEPIPPRGQSDYEENEPAYRFGFGARSHYATEYPEWDPKLQERLRSDWTKAHPERDAQWDNDVEAIQYGWDYEKSPR